MIALLARLTGVSPMFIEAVLLGLLLLAFGAGGFKIYNEGYAAAEAECQAAALQSELDAVKKDRDDARSAAADATLKLAAIEQQSKVDQERTAQYVQELENRPAPSCALTDDDLRGMRAPTAGANPAGKGAASRPGWLNGARSSPAVKAR